MLIPLAGAQRRAGISQQTTTATVRPAPVAEAEGKGKTAMVMKKAKGLIGKFK